jgi:hypothetical protein
MAQSKRTQERIAWLVQWAREHGGGITSSDSEMVEAFCKAFPEARKTQQPRLWGFQPTPMIVRTLRVGYLRGIFTRKTRRGMGVGVRVAGFPTWTIVYWLPKE